MNPFKNFVYSAMLTALLSPMVVLAQAYPYKPVRVVVPWPAGGSVDGTARIVFTHLSDSLGQQFVIDNRGGAAGTIGADLVAKSPPDGYTILVHSTTHVGNPHLYKNLPYDTLKDFVGVTPLSVQVGMLVAHPSLPVKSVRELIALAKKRPGEITYSSAGNGSGTHLMMLLFHSMTEIKMVHVPYKGGAFANTAIVSGETQVMSATIGSILPHIKSNRVRKLAVTSSTRVTQFPDVPTIAEAGVPGYEFTAWEAAFVPAGAPKAIVDKLNAELKKALTDPGVITKFSHRAQDTLYMTPGAFAQRLKNDYEKYGKLIKLIGATID